MKHNRLYLISILPLSGILLTGCADLSVLQPTVDSAVFYYIDSPLDAGKAASLDSDGIAVLVGPSSVAKYLDQPQIVTWGEPNQLVFSENKRWAEPLLENINRVLIDHLSMDLDSSRIGFQRVMSDIDWDYRLGYHVYQLVGAPGDKVHLQVSWWIVTRDGITRQFDESVFALSVDGDDSDYNAYVRTIQELIGNWAREVSSTIIKMESKSASTSDS